MKSNIVLQLISLALMIVICSFKCNEPEIPIGVKKNSGVPLMISQENYLYSVYNDSLTITDISVTEANNIVNKFKLGIYNVSRLMINKEYLFIGTGTSYYLMDLKNPINPVHDGQLKIHLNCSEIAINDTLAITTHRDNSSCKPIGNYLLVYNCRIWDYPGVIDSIPLFQPYDIDIKGNIVYVADGSEGIKVLDISNNTDIKWITTVNDDSIFFCEVQADQLVAKGETITYIYDIAIPHSPKLITQF